MAWYWYVGIAYGIPAALTTAGNWLIAAGQRTPGSSFPFWEGLLAGLIWPWTLFGPS